MNRVTLVTGGLSLALHVTFFFIHLPPSKSLPVREPVREVRVRLFQALPPPPYKIEEKAEAQAAPKPEKKVQKVEEKKEEKKKEEIKKEESPQTIQEEEPERPASEEAVEPPPLLAENESVAVAEETPALAEASTDDAQATTSIVSAPAEPVELAGSKFGVAGGTGSSDADEMSLFSALVWSKIERARFYPRSARRQEREGVVGIRFLVLPDGKVGEITVIQPSPHDILNEAAKETISRAAPFHPRPKQLDGEVLVMQIAIAFKLE